MTRQTHSLSSIVPTFYNPKHNGLSAREFGVSVFRKYFIKLGSLRTTKTDKPLKLQVGSLKLMIAQKPKKKS